MKPRLCFLLAVLTSAAAHAQVADPTVPPPEARVNAEGQAVEAVVSSAPRLQSVLIGPHRRVAVIDGETVRQGQKHRDAVLEKVTETEAVLRRGTEREVLKLFPSSGPAPAEPKQR
ncbi:MAG TPA: MSHA biogenesis protein MshK [Telluria sp.]|nr:MSHA biogenesis protein MshK [Telluria sp.]